MKLYKAMIMSLVFFAFAAPGIATAKATSNTATQSVSAKSPKVTVNVNTADATTLAKLKGIGEKKAEAIVAYRKAHGNFTSVSDLTKVKGISQRILDMNKGAIQLSDN